MAHGNRPLVLKRWQPNMQFLKGDLDRVPVWVRLYNVPLEYWTIKRLSCVAIAIGVPLYADHTTLLRKRLSYARVCIGIDASKTLVKEYDHSMGHHLLAWQEFRQFFS
jgi:hypothetical protein